MAQIGCGTQQVMIDPRQCAFFTRHIS